MFEIRIHGRGGQGSVTAAELIAAAAFYDGKFSQAFPNFGVERRGAPVLAFVRLNDKFIRLRSQIYEPESVIIQDDTLINSQPVFAGVKAGTLILINTEKKERDFKAPSRVCLRTIPATRLALEAFKKPIINTVMLGAFAAASDLISLTAIKRAISENFSGDLAEKNIDAAVKGFEFIKKN